MASFFLIAAKIAIMKNKILPLALAALSILGYSSCSKNNDDAPSTLQVRLTDAPTALEQVNIDIQNVSIKYRDDDKDSTLNWVNLTTTAGVYNLLALQNGIDTLIATGVVPERQIKEIRFILGPNNTVKNNGTVYPLTIPSGGSSGLKIKFSKKLATGVNPLLIDFDAAMSVSQNGSGAYFLRPVIRVK